MLQILINVIRLPKKLSSLAGGLSSLSSSLSVVDELSLSLITFVGNSVTFSISVGKSLWLS